MPRTRIHIAVLFYGMLTAAAVVWGILKNGDVVQLFYHPGGVVPNDGSWTVIFWGAVSGIVFGYGIARLSQYTVRRFTWSRQMHIEFRGLLGPLDNLDVLVFALLSSVGEELFFRGAMQTTLGIVASSIIFGALHIGPGKKFLPWPFLAAIIGFAFGALFWFTGNLVAPIAAHFVINYQNLHFINRYDPSHHLTGKTL
ncbi:MAG: CPBP family intramembrane metalloprotease [Deltaproteobacteria bacterium]|nr:CPBP family intramembrane metalloprotease [Deltaproteobacteria bacterium]